MLRAAGRRPEPPPVARDGKARPLGALERVVRLQRIDAAEGAALVGAGLLSVGTAALLLGLALPAVLYISGTISAAVMVGEMSAIAIAVMPVKFRHSLRSVPVG